MHQRICSVCGREFQTATGSMFARWQARHAQDLLRRMVRRGNSHVSGCDAGIRSGAGAQKTGSRRLDRAQAANQPRRITIARAQGPGVYGLSSVSHATALMYHLRADRGLIPISRPALRQLSSSSARSLTACRMRSLGRRSLRSLTAQSAS